MKPQFLRANGSVQGGFGGAGRRRSIARTASSGDEEASNKSASYAMICRIEKDRLQSPIRMHIPNVAKMQSQSLKMAFSRVHHYFAHEGFNAFEGAGPAAITGLHNYCIGIWRNLMISRALRKI